MIGAVGVVVPAHDEEALLPACLASLRVAAGHPDLADLPVQVVVVLDDCTDRSAQVTAAAAGVTAVEVRARNVGVARAAGAERVLAECPVEPSRLWLAMTDADTVVPPDWLARQLAHAAAGADVVAGTVRVADADWRDHPADTVRRFAGLYGSPSAAGHPHVHGANLGVRGSTYLAVGGLEPRALAEDHALLDACVAAGAAVVRAGDLPVTTSARLRGRAAGGFADLLRSLAATG